MDKDLKEVVFLRKRKNRVSKKAVEANRCNGERGGRPCKPLEWVVINREYVIDAPGGGVVARNPKHPSRKKKLKPNRYRAVLVNGCCVKVHRIIWESVHGPLLPGTVIDHMDGDPSNNRLENLRAVTVRANSKNSKLFTSNTSGLPGIRKTRSGASWHVQISLEKKRLFASFTNKGEAAAFALEVYKAAGYSPRHYAPIEEFLAELKLLGRPEAEAGNPAVPVPVPGAAPQ